MQRIPRPRHQIYAELPPELQRADELLHLYGQWATRSTGGGRAYGSIERQYEAPRSKTREARREPKPTTLHIDDAMRAQKALQAVPDVERKVLIVLYIPRGMPAEQQLRLLRIPPQLSSVRHLAGVKIWWNWWRLTGGE